MHQRQRRVNFRWRCRETGGKQDLWSSLIEFTSAAADAPLEVTVPPGPESEPAFTEPGRGRASVPRDETAHSTTAVSLARRMADCSDMASYIGTKRAVSALSNASRLWAQRKPIG